MTVVETDLACDRTKFIFSSQSRRLVIAHAHPSSSADAPAALKSLFPPPIDVFTVHDSCRPPSAAIRAKPYLARGVPPDRPRRARVARDRRLDPRRRATRATHFQHPPRAVPRPSARHRPREGAARDRPPRSIARSFVRSFDARASRPSRASSSRASSRVARRLKNTHLDLGRLEGGDAADEGGSEKGRHYD